jgi:hypothetical protein
VRSNAGHCETCLAITQWQEKQLLVSPILVFSACLLSRRDGASGANVVNKTGKKPVLRPISLLKRLLKAICSKKTIPENLGKRFRKIVRGHPFYECN